MAATCPPWASVWPEVSGQKGSTRALPRIRKQRRVAKETRTDRRTYTPTDMLRLIRNHSHGTETRPSSAPTSTLTRAHTGADRRKVTPVQHRDAARNTEAPRSRKAWAHTEVNNTNAHLEASRVPPPGTPNPTPMHPDLRPPPPTPTQTRARAHAGIFPFKHLARSQEVTSTAAISSALTVKYFWCTPWKFAGIETQFHPLGFVWSWTMYACAGFGTEKVVCFNF